MGNKFDQKELDVYFENKREESERLCDCGDCRYCDAVDSSEYDYEGEDFACSRCNGAGCTRCE